MVSMATQNALLKNGDVPTKVLISQQQVNLKFCNLVPTDCLDIGLSSNVQICKFDIICIFMNINENIRNRRKLVKNKGVYMQIYLHLSYLLSYTTNLCTNLMLIHSMFT